MKIFRQSNLAIYPKRQPFPKNPVVSISAEVCSDDPDKSALATYLYPPYDIAERELSSYMRLASAKADSTNDGDRSGTAIGIRGTSGSGKTHLIYYLMQRGRSQLPRGYQIYVKAESGDLLDLYSRALQFLGRVPLREIHTRLLSHVAQRELIGHDDEAPPQSTVISQSLAQQLILEPDAVYALLKNRILSESTLLSARSDVLEGARSYFDDFLHAYSYLLHDTLSDDAFDWICGRRLPFDVLQRLGVRSNIADEEMAFTGFRFLIALFSRIKQPFFLFIDQIERLIVDTEPSIRAVNKGRLHTLVELVNTAGGFLVLAGMTKAWDEFPADFIERLSVPPFKMPAITTDQIFKLIAIYLHPTQMNPQYRTETDIYPFQEGAVLEISKIARGNIRAILSLCNRSFEEAASNLEPITPDLIRKAATQLKRSFDRANILMQVKMILKKLGMNCVQDFAIEGFTRMDLAVPDAKNPRLLIDVSEPNFLEDEARAAIRYVGMANIIRARWPDAKIIIVEAGYVSADVQEKLRPYLDAHIVYNPDEFAAEFTAAAEMLSKYPSSSLESRGKGMRETTIVDQLREILEARTSEQQTISSNVKEILVEKNTPSIFTDATVKAALIGVALIVAFSAIFAVVQFIQYQRSQIEAQIGVAERQNALESEKTKLNSKAETRKETFQRLEVLNNDKGFKSDLAEFYRTADLLGKTPTYSDDQRTKLKNMLLDIYNNVAWSFAHLTQCAISQVCDVDVVCTALGEEIQRFVLTAQKYEISSQSTLTSFLNACKIPLR
jgi:hypothetical protein